MPLSNDIGAQGCTFPRCTKNPIYLYDVNRTVCRAIGGSFLTIGSFGPTRIPIKPSTFQDQNLPGMGLPMEFTTSVVSELNAVPKGRRGEGAFSLPSSPEKRVGSVLDLSPLHSNGVYGFVNSGQLIARGDESVSLNIDGPEGEDYPDGFQSPIEAINTSPLFQDMYWDDRRQSIARCPSLVYDFMAGTTPMKKSSRFARLLQSCSPFPKNRKNRFGKISNDYPLEENMGLLDEDEMYLPEKKRGILTSPLEVIRPIFSPKQCLKEPSTDKDSEETNVGKKISFFERVLGTPKKTEMENTLRNKSNTVTSPLQRLRMSVRNAFDSTPREKGVFLDPEYAEIEDLQPKTEKKGSEKNARGRSSLRLVESNTNHSSSLDDADYAQIGDLTDLGIGTSRHAKPSTSQRKNSFFGVTEAKNHKPFCSSTNTVSPAAKSCQLTAIPKTMPNGSEGTSEKTSIGHSVNSENKDISKSKNRVFCDSDTDSNCTVIDVDTTLKNRSVNDYNALVETEKASSTLSNITGDRCDPKKTAEPQLFNNMLMEDADALIVPPNTPNHSKTMFGKDLKQHFERLSTNQTTPIKSGNLPTSSHLSRFNISTCASSIHEQSMEPVPNTCIQQPGLADQTNQKISGTETTCGPIHSCRIDNFVKRSRLAGQLSPMAAVWPSAESIELLNQELMADSLNSKNGDNFNTDRSGISGSNNQFFGDSDSDSDSICTVIFNTIVRNRPKASYPALPQEFMNVETNKVESGEPETTNMESDGSEIKNAEYVDPKVDIVQSIGSEDVKVDSHRLKSTVENQIPNVANENEVNEVKSDGLESRNHFFGDGKSNNHEPRTLSVAASLSNLMISDKENTHARSPTLMDSTTHSNPQTAVKQVSSYPLTENACSVMIPPDNQTKSSPLFGNGSRQPFNNIPEHMDNRELPGSEITTSGKPTSQNCFFGVNEAHNYDPRCDEGGKLDMYSKTIVAFPTIQITPIKPYIKPKCSPVSLERSVENSPNEFPLNSVGDVRFELPEWSSSNQTSTPKLTAIVPPDVPVTPIKSIEFPNSPRVTWITPKPSPEVCRSLDLPNTDVVLCSPFTSVALSPAKDDYVENAKQNLVELYIKQGKELPAFLTQNGKPYPPQQSVQSNQVDNEISHFMVIEAKDVSVVEDSEETFDENLISPEPISLSQLVPNPLDVSNRDAAPPGTTTGLNRSLELVALHDKKPLNHSCHELNLEKLQEALTKIWKQNLRDEAELKYPSLQQRPIVMDSSGLKLDAALAKVFGHSFLMQNTPECSLLSDTLASSLSAVSIAAPHPIKPCISKADLLEEVPIYPDHAETPAPTPFKIDHLGLKPDPPVVPKDLPKRRRPIINLMFPKKTPKKVTYTDGLIDNKKTFDDVVNSGRTGFRILSVHDKNRSTVKYPKYVAPKEDE